MSHVLWMGRQRLSHPPAWPPGGYGAAGTPGYPCDGALEFALCAKRYVPPLGQPAMTSYLEFNDGWPAGAWLVAEPSYWLSGAIHSGLAKYVR
jgi:hypothetical protein